MGQDLLKFLRPASPSRSATPSPRASSRASIARHDVKTSITTLCSFPASATPKRTPLFRKPRAPVVLEPESPRIMLEPCKRPRARPISTSQLATKPEPAVLAPRPKSTAMYLAEAEQRTTEIALVDGGEVLRTRDSEVYHIGQLRNAARSRKDGAWVKVQRASLTSRERAAFHALRATANGPVCKEDILAHCAPVLKTSVMDDKHKPFMLPMQQQGRRPAGSRAEFLEVDPFTGWVYVVRWHPDASPAISSIQTAARIQTTTQQQAAQCETLNEISTIRIVT